MRPDNMEADSRAGLNISYAVPLLQ